MKLPCRCPSCQEQLQVKSLQCGNCGTEVSGLYRLPALAQLSDEDQDFIVRFVKSSGSLKDMAKQLSLSYPTVRNRLDDIIRALTDIEEKTKSHFDELGKAINQSL